MITTEKAIATLLAESACVRRRRSIGGCHRDCIKCDLGLQGEEILEAIQMAGLVLDMKTRSIPMRLKPCPFCGAMLEYEEHVAILAPGQPTLQLWAHPAGGCILSGMEVPKEDHEAWNRRTE